MVNQILKVTSVYNLRLKNRIREHGDLWKVLDTGHAPCLNGKNGMLIQSLATKHERWVAYGDLTWEETEGLA